MKAVIFDTETTGLIKNRMVSLDKLPEIIEFYACLIDFDDPETILDEIDFLIKPSLMTELPPIIEKVTGLNYDRDLKDKKFFRSFAESIKSFLQDADFVIAHNFAFDRDMVEIEMERLNMTMEWPTPICTVEQTRHIKGFNLNLGKLYELLFDEKMKSAHRAKVDVQNLVKVCKRLSQDGVLPIN